MPRSALDRRAFLELSLGSLSALGFAPSWLRAVASRIPAGARRLVVLELFGGNDGLNTLVPFEDDLYHRARPSIALRKAGLLPVDELNGLHPSLAKLRAWLEQGRVAIVRGVGYPQPNLSHFTSRDIWSTARLDWTSFAGGWLGDWSARTSGGDPLSMLALGSCDAPRLLRGPGCLAPAVPDLSSFHFGGGGDPGGGSLLSAFAALARAPGADPESAYVQQMIEVAMRSSRALSATIRASRGANYPGTQLGRDLAGVADVIAADLSTRVFHVQLSGFDTHSKQLATQAGLLAELDVALDAFLTDLRALRRLDDTLVLTVSEFGRRLAQNGVGSEAGSDHGAASVQFVCGGKVRPGLHGPQPDLERLDADGNPPHRIDFRSVYATVLERWLETDPEPILGASYPVFPLLEVA